MKILRRRRRQPAYPYATATAELLPTPCLSCSCCSSLLCATAQICHTSWLQDCAYHCEISQTRQVEQCPCSAMGRMRISAESVTKVTPPPPSLSGA